MLLAATLAGQKGGNTAGAEVLDAAVAPPVILEATPVPALEFVNLQELQAHALDEWAGSRAAAPSRLRKPTRRQPALRSGDGTWNGPRRHIGRRPRRAVRAP